ncbi:enolase-phosphatase E1 [Polyergus mexicanus]|uniref:enolase-phosphatase E1 n=1 Tax=Polyergus mexicanus TaxID=615972 RepID=UPI0038B4DBF6
MSNPEEMDSYVSATQETYKNAKEEDPEKRSFNENQNASWGESQDFCLIVEGDESMTEREKLSIEDEDANRQDSTEQSNLQQIPNTSQTDDKVVANDEIKNIEDEKIMKNESVGNVFSDVNDSERKNELSDEDEIIQATPPQNHSPSKKGAGNIDITGLKRKAESIDEPPVKVVRTMSMEDIADTEKRLEKEEEESRQSGESDDSYQDLFKNIDRHIVIEETQDPINQEFTQNSLASSLERTTIDDDKTQNPHHSEQVNQQEEVISEKCCNMEKDENLNVSAKLTDVSANDSIVVNINSINESDSQVEDSDLPIEAKRNADSTVAVEKSATETLDETDKSVKVKNIETFFGESNKVEHTNCIEKTVDDDKKISSSQIKLRTSVELIYESASQTVDNDEKKSKPEVVEIDEDEGDKIVDSSTEVIYDRKNTKPEPEVVEIVDDSHEDVEKTRPGLVPDSGEGSEIQTVEKSSIDFSYKSTESMKESSLDSRPPTTDNKMVNGSLEFKKADNDVTLSMESDTFSGCDAPIFTKTDINVDNVKKLDNVNSFVFRDPDNIELISLSDTDTSNVEEKSKSDLIHNNAPIKTVQMEREIGIYVKLKCMIHMDESTKEYVNKELTAVHCEPVIESTMSRQKNEDSQSSLADISDNKDSPPGSVNSNPHLYQLNPSRLSIMSSISSSSSASSAAALAAKLALKALGPARYTKKLSSQESLLTDKLVLDEIYNRVTREWKNHHLVTATILNCANTELSTTNVSNIELTDHRNSHHLRDNFVRSSTPSEDAAASAKIELTATPKNTKKGKAVKRPRSKVAKSSAVQTNGNEDIANINTELTLHASSVAETDTPSGRKKSRLESTENKLGVDILANSSLRNDPADELIGKSVFAKWSDNNYYPGMVNDRLKTKYKVNFYDGKSKTLIPEFVIPIPKILREGLSVYATTKANDYGSCGIIVDSHMSSTISNSEDNSDTYYTVETDEGERLRVQVRDIFLSADQAQVLKEEVDSASKSSMPNTPKTLGQVTLDNMVDGKRRSKRIGTPVFSTPKSKSNGTSSSTSKIKSSEPSVSGVSVRLKDALSENEGLSSDSNIESVQVQDEYVLLGLQKEIIGTPYEQIMKGPQNRIKGKPRNKKKVEDPQTIATLGPIPTNSNIFKGMSFILTCVSLETLDRYKDTASAASGIETEATDTDIETENEEDWVERPFVRHRLHAQILAGGGKIYEDFDQIPKHEYKNTKLITNVPNTTAKSILCLSVGIPACNHKWIIRCCSEGKIVNAAEDALPTGWSLQKKAYVEMFQADKSKPLLENIVIIPNLVSVRQFITFWRQVCENAGAVVLIADNLGAMEALDFDSNVIVLSNRRCPSWAVDRANHLQIPILSTTWVIQCLIEGKLCPHDQHSRYKYNCIPN